METICALSTPYGCGGIAVVRVSGSEAISLVDSVFRGRQSLCEAAANSIHYGQIARGEEVLDEVLVSVFRAPHSFTGEDTVEISCHGSLYIQQELLQWLVDAGCRMAKAGEFTQRSFLNGKMDLTKAEAVADLIAAQSKAEKDLAISQLRGSVSSELGMLREQLLHFTSLVELELDFADHEELEFADRGQLRDLAAAIAGRLRQLTQSFRTGNAIRNGVPVAIIGAPNVGKSTLLNALLGEERAIVSNIQGTTRDTIEDTIVIDGLLFRLIDTAGLRQTADRIESMGIARSRQAAERAQIVVLVEDAREAASGEALASDMLPDMTGKTLLRVRNKADLVGARPAAEGSEIWLSAKSGDVEALRQALVEAVRSEMTTGAVTISNARHYEALTRALEAIERVQQGIADGLSGELLSMDLQDCLEALGEITGQITSEEVLHSIFSHFCIGK